MHRCGFESRPLRQSRRIDMSDEAIPEEGDEESGPAEPTFSIGEPEGEPEAEMTDEEFAARYEVAREDTTCWRCEDKDSCPWAWDPYNTDGDCLADK